MPADGQDILIPIAEETLQASGYLCADEFRNAFGMAFAANGDPIDAEIIGNRIYVIEWSGGRGLWEITLPGSSATAVEKESGSAPDGYALAQNYPNPFNSNTTIAYEVGSEGPNDAGQNICGLVQGRLAAGRYAVKCACTA